MIPDLSAEDPLDASGRECDCPPPWLPPTAQAPVRMLHCCHFQETVIRLFRHADLPHIACLETRTNDEPEGLPAIFLGYSTALAAFEAAAERLRRGEL